MSSADNYSHNGSPKLVENKSQNDFIEKVKSVVINTDPQIINEVSESNKIGERNRKISRQDKMDETSDCCNTLPINNGKISTNLKYVLQDIKVNTKTTNDSTSNLENSEMNIKQNGVSETRNSINNDFRSKTRDVATVNSKSSAKSSVADERLTERRKSFVPMSSMEEENLRERLHLAQLKKCNEIISKDLRYTKENFRKLFQTEVSLTFYY